MARSGATIMTPPRTLREKGKLRYVAHRLFKYHPEEVAMAAPAAAPSRAPRRDAASCSLICFSVNGYFGVSKFLSRKYRRTRLHGGIPTPAHRRLYLKAALQSSSADSEHSGFFRSGREMDIHCSVLRSTMYFIRTFRYSWKTTM